MDYNTVYLRICYHGQTRVRGKGQYLEKHHIMPKCLGGSNTINNLTLLTAREHYIAHHLLCRMHKNSDISTRSKLASAFNRMVTYNKHNRRFTSRQFEVARKTFSENHPMKNKATRDKVSAALRERGIITKVLRNQDLPYCMCGCEKRVKTKYQRYLYNHWDRSVTKTGFTTEVRKILSDKAIQRIKSLTDEEKTARLQKSLHSVNVDHIMRGRSISLGKKGKKTKQLDIMGTRFSNMSDSEFAAYLNTVSSRVWTRYTKLRNKWLNKK